MKKYLTALVICVLVGTLFGKIMFDQYQKEDTKQASTTPVENVYFFQIGVYSKLDNLKSARELYPNSVYMKKDDRYYLFVGMTKDEQNKQKLKDYFDSLSYDIYIKQMDLDNAGFLETLTEYDKLLKDANTVDEIANINKTILAKYEELVNNG